MIISAESICDMERKQAFVNSSLFHIGIIIVIEIILNFYTYIEKIGVSM